MALPGYLDKMPRALISMRERDCPRSVPYSFMRYELSHLRIEIFHSDRCSLSIHISPSI